MKGPTAVLSTTAKVKAREKRKAAADGDVAMDVVVSITVSSFGAHELTVSPGREARSQARC